MSANPVQMTIQKGVSWNFNVTLTDESGSIDLTDSTVRSMLWQFPDDNTPALTFVCTITNALSGQFNWYASPAQTSALNFTKGDFYVDVEDAAGDVFRYIWGTLIVEGGATQ